jgi:Ca2+-binding RTX toxin-like protein
VRVRSLLLSFVVVVALVTPASAYHQVPCGGEMGGHGSDPDFPTSSGNDTYTGTTGHNVWSGWGGNDIIRGAPYGSKGQDAGDTLCGDNGSGNDGVDHMWGYAGADKLLGGPKGDYIHGGPGNDDVYAHAGNDSVVGSTGDDLLSGNDGVDEVQGDDGADRIYGDAHDDKLYGGAGNDYFNGGTGTDTCYGNAGNDSFVNCETSVQGSVNGQTLVKLLGPIGLRPSI